MIDYKTLTHREKQLYMKAAMRALFHFVKQKEACDKLGLKYSSVLNWVCTTTRMMKMENFEKLENFYLPYLEEHKDDDITMRLLELEFMRNLEKQEEKNNG